MTELLNNFANDNGYILPDKSFSTEKWLREKLQRYCRAWKKFYHRQWYYQDFALDEFSSFYEAYTGSFRFTGDYLRGDKPFFMSDRLNLECLVKKLLKSPSILNILRKIRNKFL